MYEEHETKPRRISETVVKQDVQPSQPDDLKTKLQAVLQEDPGVVEVQKNPWLHDVFVRKVKALIE